MIGASVAGVTDKRIVAIVMDQEAMAPRPACLTLCGQFFERSRPLAEGRAERSVQPCLVPSDNHVVHLVRTIGKAQVANIGI